MQFSHYAYLAMELARERMLEAEAHHRYAHTLAAPAGPGRARRTIARAAAAVSRASASVARRLDDAAIEPEALGRRSTTA